MDNSQQMPKVNTKSDRLTAVELEYMKQFEKQNFERAGKLKTLRKANIRTGFVLGALVLGIYSYTFLSVKQETFLDDFEEPERITVQA